MCLCTPLRCKKSPSDQVIRRLKVCFVREGDKICENKKRLHVPDVHAQINDRVSIPVLSLLEIRKIRKQN